MADAAEPAALGAAAAHRRAAGIPTIYLRLIGSRVRSQLQYRASFALRLSGTFLITLTDFIAILVIFTHLPLLAGWRLEEVAFLYGSSYVAVRLGDLLVGHVESLPTFIRSGEFDTILIRPLGSLFQVVTSDFQLRQLGGVAQGAIIFVFAGTRLGVDWTPARIGVLFMMLAAGTAIFCAIWVLGNCIAFWFIDSREVANAFTYGGNQLTSYPLNVYGPWVRRLLAFVIPTGFVNYFPALYILDKADPLGLPRALQFASPLVAAATAAVAGIVWRIAVRHYRSTGS